jgi:hypothetical protein
MNLASLNKRIERLEKLHKKENNQERINQVFLKIADQLRIRDKEAGNTLEVDRKLKELFSELNTLTT